jgi:hypothetical protein
VTALCRDGLTFESFHQWAYAEELAPLEAVASDCNPASKLHPVKTTDEARQGVRNCSAIVLTLASSTM